MFDIFTKAKNWYSKYERPISSAALLGGFAWNAIVLKRVDLFWENFWVIIHLLIIAGCILVINRQESLRQEGQERGKIHFWLITILQFTFGGLLSTYLVFYFRSATLAVTWPFLLILTVAFITNERFKDRYDRLALQISFLYLALFSFSIFIVPVIFNQIGTGIFIVSGITSLCLILLFIALLKNIARERVVKSKNTLLVIVASIFVAVNGLYFLNLIPPIPLSLKDAGVYHSVFKDPAGNYVVATEEAGWLHYLSLNKTIHIVQGEPVYAFSAIFSPTAFHTDIIHEWQLYDASTKKWVTASRVNLMAVGGREGGFRTYSKKSIVPAGKWRVNVETKQGQIIGRLRFDVDIVETEPELHFENKD